jgi:hypothetical protein
LLDGAKRILPSFAESLSRKAARRLERLGVKIITEALVEKVDQHGVIVAGRRIESATVVWTAGVAPAPILKLLNAKTDRAGRVCITPFLSVPDHPEVFVVGDAAALTQDGRALPGVAQVAIQEGRYVVRIQRRSCGAKARCRITEPGGVRSEPRQQSNSAVSACCCAGGGCSPTVFRSSSALRVAQSTRRGPKSHPYGIRPRPPFHWHIALECHRTRLPRPQASKAAGLSSFASAELLAAPVWLQFELVTETSTNGDVVTAKPVGIHGLNIRYSRAKTVPYGSKQ